MCISNKFLDDANNAGLGNILWESLSRLRVWQEWLIGKSTFYYQKKERKEGCRQGVAVNHSCNLIKRKKFWWKTSGHHRLLQQFCKYREIWSPQRNLVCLLVHDIDRDMNWFFCLYNFAEIQYRSEESNQRQYFLLLRAMYHFKCDMTCHTNLF